MADKIKRKRRNQQSAEVKRKKRLTMSDADRKREAKKQADYRRRGKIKKNFKDDKIRLLNEKVARLAKTVERLEKALTIANTPPNIIGEAEDDDDDDDGDEDEKNDKVDAERSFTGQRVENLMISMAKSDRRLFTDIGFAMDQFNDLYDDLSATLASTTMRGGERVRKYANARKLSDRQQLFVSLYFLKSRPTYRQLALTFDLPVFYFRKIIVRVVAALVRCATEFPASKGGFDMPQSEEDMIALMKELEIMTQPGLEEFFLCLDGMHMPVPAPPQDLHAALKAGLWNGKHKCWAMMVLIVCDLRGRLKFVSAPTTLQEASVLKTCGLKDVLRKIDAGVISDAGFCLNTAADVADKQKSIKHAWSYGPLTHSRCKEVLADDESSAQLRQYARQSAISAKLASSMRIVVENAIARIRLWRSVNGVFRGHSWQNERKATSLNIGEVLTGVSFLVNRQMAVGKACRAADWVATKFDEDYKYGFPETPRNPKKHEKAFKKLYVAYSEAKRPKKGRRQSAPTPPVESDRDSDDETPDWLLAEPEEVADNAKWAYIPKRTSRRQQNLANNESLAGDFKIGHMNAQFKKNNKPKAKRSSKRKTR